MRRGSRRTAPAVPSAPVTAAAGPLAAVSPPPIAVDPAVAAAGPSTAAASSSREVAVVAVAWGAPPAPDGHRGCSGSKAAWGAGGVDWGRSDVVTGLDKRRPTDGLVATQTGGRTRDQLRIQRLWMGSGRGEKDGR